MTSTAAPPRVPTVAQIVAAMRHARPVPDTQPPDQGGLVIDGSGHSPGRIFPPDFIAGLRGRMIDYLTRAGVELHQRGARIVGKCPRHDDQHPSFAVWGEGFTVAGCYPCDFRGDVFAVSQWLGRAGTFPEAVADVAGTLGATIPAGVIVGTAGTRRPAPRRHEAERIQPAPIRLPELPAGFEDACTLARACLWRECVAESAIACTVADELGTDIDTLRGLCFTSDAVGIEMTARGRPVIFYLYEHGAKIRHPRGHVPRFEWSHGRAVLPWRWHFAERPEVATVYVTEGESDAIAAIAAGLEVLHPRDGSGASAVVACPGSSFPAAWGPLFAGKRAVLMFDADQAGRDGAERAAAIIHPYAASVRITEWNRFEK